MDALVAAGLVQQVLIDVVSFGVPDFEMEEFVNLGQEFLSDRAIPVHVNVLADVVDANLGSGDSSQVDEGDVVEESLVSLGT